MTTIAAWILDARWTMSTSSNNRLSGRLEAGRSAGTLSGDSWSRTVRVVSTILGVAVLLQVGCSETSEKAFLSMTNRGAQDLIERGWIPEDLPRSATDVRVRWNLDTNMVRGSVRLKKEELADMRVKLHPLGENVIPPFWQRASVTPAWWPRDLNPPKSVSALRADGWEIFTFPSSPKTYAAIRSSEGRLYFWCESS
jgi:hypothetical protein